MEPSLRNSELIKFDVPARVRNTLSYTNNAWQKGAAWDHNPAGKLKGTNEGLKFFQGSRFVISPLMQGLFGPG